MRKQFGTLCYVEEPLGDQHPSWDARVEIEDKRSDVAKVGVPGRWKRRWGVNAPSRIATEQLRS